MSNSYILPKSDNLKGLSLSFLIHMIFIFSFFVILSKVQSLVQKPDTERIAYRVNLVASREDLQTHTGSVKETTPMTRIVDDAQTSVIERQETSDNSHHNTLPIATKGEDPVSVDILGIGPQDPYIKSIVRKVGSYYTDPLGSGAGLKKVTIKFIIKRNGDITNVEIEESSGNFSLDMAALRAVKNSSPLPPLPDKFSDSLVVHFYFEHRQ